jgi:flagellar basal body rod protein FlgG
LLFRLFHQIAVRDLMMTRGMIRGLYSSANALQWAEQNHELIAHNLANANMPGYRRQVIAFDQVAQPLTANAAQPADDSAQFAAPRPITVFEPGELQFTERPLDLALKGDGFFVVNGPNGPLYTRNGVFDLTADGVLQTSGGLPVSGSSGRITIPPGTLQIVVREDGTVVADNNEVGKLKLANFNDPTRLTHAGTTLFEAPPGVVPTDSKATVNQGYREQSNVQIVDEMVRMIAGMRMYEASQRSLDAMSDAVEQHINGQVR